MVIFVVVLIPYSRPLNTSLSREFPTRSVSLPLTYFSNSISHRKILLSSLSAIPDIVMDPNRVRGPQFKSLQVSSFSSIRPVLHGNDIFVYMCLKLKLNEVKII